MLHCTAFYFQIADLIEKKSNNGVKLHSIDELRRLTCCCKGFFDELKKYWTHSKDAAVLCYLNERRTGLGRQDSRKQLDLTAAY